MHLPKSFRVRKLIFNATIALLVTPAASRAALVDSYSMNESSGSLADSVGGVTMTPANSSAFTYGDPSVPAGTYGAITISNPAAFGTAVSTNGTSYFSNATANNPLNTLAAPFTVMAWIKPTVISVTPATNHRVIGGTAGDGNGWGYGFNNNGAQLMTTFGKTDIAQTTGTVQQNAWQHVAAAYTLSGTTATINFYLNGNLVDTRTGTTFTPNTSETFYLFATPNAALTAFDYFPGGSIDEVKVFNTALTQPEVAAAAVPVPEPAGAALVAAGAAAGLLSRRRRE